MVRPTKTVFTAALVAGFLSPILAAPLANAITSTVVESKPSFVDASVKNLHLLNWNDPTATAATPPFIAEPSALLAAPTAIPTSPVAYGHHIPEAPLRTVGSYHIQHDGALTNRKKHILGSNQVLWDGRNKSAVKDKFVFYDGEAKTLVPAEISQGFLRPAEEEAQKAEATERIVILASNSSRHLDPVAESMKVTPSNVNSESSYAATKRDVSNWDDSDDQYSIDCWFSIDPSCNPNGRYDGAGKPKAPPKPKPKKLEDSPFAFFSYYASRKSAADLSRMEEVERTKALATTTLSMPGATVTATRTRSKFADISQKTAKASASFRPRKLHKSYKPREYVPSTADFTRGQPTCEEDPVICESWLSLKPVAKFEGPTTMVTTSYSKPKFAVRSIDTEEAGSTETSIIWKTTILTKTVNVIKTAATSANDSGQSTSRDPYLRTRDQVV